MTQRSARATEEAPGFAARVLDQVVTAAVGLLPHGPGANELKAALLAVRGARVGRRAKLWSGVWMDRFDRLWIGDDVTVGKDAILVCGGGVQIGHRAMVGHGSKLISAGHRIPEGRAPMRFAGLVYGKVTIGDDSWVAAQAVVLPGVTVGEGAIVAAGAVVTRDVPPFAVVAGVPARVVRIRS
ncbi:MAG: acyltransferase [Deltaproteobacteria bacterium]|nr:acyltransferase [Deltaproteobacteria bacterium]